jgi:peptidoglycan-associated lipoprotein
MNVRSYLVALSAPVMLVALIACDSGPSTPVGQAPQEQPAQGGQGQPAPTLPAPTSQPREFAAAAELKSIHFAFDQAKIGSSEAGRLRDSMRWLKSHADMVVLVGGHADERGSDTYNTKLGERRANAVKSYLIANGVEADRITTATFGEGSPVCSQRTEACWAKNRRADLQVKAR